jgi:endonuclease III
MAKSNMNPRAALALLEKLRALHPDAHCELDHASPFQLLCATVMSAQTTDVAVNKVTPALFAAYPDARRMAQAEPLAIEALINRIGMYRQKAKNLVALAQLLMANHGGEVPQTLPELIALPGVGRKTANVVLGVAFGVPEGVVVDTHVQRLSQRLGLSRNREPEKIEADLVQLLPRNVWDITSHTLIFHGRRVCDARKPNCDECGVSAQCPSAFAAIEVGRKAVAQRAARTKPGAKTAAVATQAGTRAATLTAAASDAVKAATPRGRKEARAVTPNAARGPRKPS